MQTVLKACEELANYTSFFTVNNLLIKLGEPFTRESIKEILTEYDEHIYVVDDIVFMKDFAKYATELLTLDLCVLSLLHMAVDPKNAHIKDFLLKKIRIIRNDL